MGLYSPVHIAYRPYLYKVYVFFIFTKFTNISYSRSIYDFCLIYEASSLF